MKDNLSYIISTLTAERKRKGITQKQLEVLSGVKQPIIARLEKGVTKPNLDTVLKLAEALNLSLNIKEEEKTFSSGYTYKRIWYSRVKESLKKNNVTLLLGPRKCGKTVCMYQLYEDIAGSIYFDAKTHTDDENREFCNSVISSVVNNEDKTYLIDEITYLQYPDLFLSNLGREFTVRDSKTRVVISGSQSVALKAWGMRAFASNAQYLYMDFLTYPEWLEYKGISEVSDKTYNRFILGTKEFYHDFTDARSYIEGCIDETVRSNDKAKDLIYNNDADGLTADFLIDIMFATLVILKDNPRDDTFVKKSNLFEALDHSYHDEIEKIGKENVVERINYIAGNKYEGLKRLDPYLFIRGLKFLYNCGLIGVVPIISDIDDDIPYDVFAYLNDRYGTTVISKAEDRRRLFGEINFYIKYPMFYCEIIKELLGTEFQEITKEILGNIVECHIRGLLDEKGSAEYRSEDYAEIDYVNRHKKIAIEIATFNKRKRDTHFEQLDDSYKKILTSQDKSDYVDDIQRIPYPEMIYKLSLSRTT